MTHLFSGFLSKCAVLTGILFAGVCPQLASAQTWRLGYVNADLLSAASFPFSYYNHIAVLGLNCNGSGSLYNQWGYDTANWSAYRAEASANNVKLLLLIGGNMTSRTSAGSLSSYVSKIVNTVNGTDKSLNSQGVVFDGVDLDWEAGMSNSVTGQYQNLISALRSSLGASKSISVDGWVASYFATVIVNQQNNIDRFNNEMYDSAVNGSSNSSGQEWSWYNLANKSANSNDSGSAEGGFAYYVAAGFPASKINEGIPLYGYLYSGCSRAEVLGCTASNTQYTYKSIRNNSTWWNSAHQYDSSNGSSYIPLSNQYLTYTDTNQIADLTKWGNGVNLGGYFTWEVDFEALSSGSQAQNFPLSYALYADTSSSTSYTAPSITSTSPLPAATVGSAYSLKVSASGSTPMTWAVTSGSLPSGLSLNSTSGIVSGTPSTASSATFTVTASNAAGSNSRQFALTTNAQSGAPKWYNLVSKNSGMCPDVLGISTSAGGTLDQWPCSGVNNQNFQFVAVQGGYKITAQNSGLQLDVQGASKSNGAAIIQYPYWGGKNQIWNLVPNSDGSYSISAG